MIPSSIPINTKLKIVVDTNQFLSVFIFRGQLMRLVFELVLEEKIAMYVSPALKEEVLEKLHYFGTNEQVQADVMSFIDEKGILLNPTVKVTVCKDRDDNFTLELSETADAHYLITRDKALLDLKQWKNTNIIPPEDFLPILRKMELIE